MRIETLKEISNIMELNKYMDKEEFSLKSMEYDEGFEKCNLKYICNNEIIDITIMVYNSNYEFGIPYDFKILMIKIILND